jgi:tRNA modification GTPase
MTSSLDDTIVALSTPLGTGAIAVIRLTGRRALDISGEVFVRQGKAFPSREESHRLIYGHIVDPSVGSTLDEVLVAAMYAPVSYTREDMVEVHCHGGQAAVRSILRLFIERGARPAEPGEFTKRAFLNGRLDLAQAESVANVIRARSTSALRAAVHQLRGGLSGEVSSVRRLLVEVLAEVEASVDFADEDVDDIDRDGCAMRVGEAGRLLESLLDTAFFGRILDEGLQTAIVGGANVGKSSLLNCLVRRERAIVSEVPGTTRDTVEELVEFAGVPVVLIDTAGIRSSDDKVEQLGVARSRAALENADIVLAVVDLSEWGSPDDAALWTARVEGLVGEVEAERIVVVGNKLDIAPEDAPHNLRERSRRASRGGNGIRRVVCVSALTGEGIDSLKAAIADVIGGEGGLAPEEPMLSTERQRSLVARSHAAALKAAEGLSGGLPEELVAEDIREAVRALGEVTGEEITEDLLDEIFSRFCIGK